MLKAAVLGNGESRKHINLEDLKLNYTLIGCNAIHRDITVDHLVCCDNRMVKEALNNPKQQQIYTRSRYYQEHRKILKHKNVYKVPDLPYKGFEKFDDPQHWGSGPYAVLLAATLGFSDISLIGFDLYGKKEKINNIYKGTNNYSKINSSAVDPAFWIIQIKKVFEHFSETQFKIYNEDSWIMPISWDLENVSRHDVLTINNILV